MSEGPQTRQETATAPDDWAGLLTAPLQIQLGHLLRLVPNFHKALLTPEEGRANLPTTGENSIQAAHLDAVPAVPVTDVRIPEIVVDYKGVSIDQVLIDRGASVNIVTKVTCLRMG